MFSISRLKFRPSRAGVKNVAVLVSGRAGAKNTPLIRTFKSRVRDSVTEQPARIVRQTVKTAQQNSGPKTNVLLKPFLFVIGGSLASYAGCAVWEYESVRHTALYPRQDRPDGFQEIRKAFDGRQQIYVLWSSKDFTTGKKLIFGIIGINAIVFALWRIPVFAPVMNRFFQASPYGKAPCWSLLGSMFSHTSLLHLACNMYVLKSFAGPVVDVMGPEQTLAFYISAGLASGFVSHCLKVARGSLVPSVGASGAILGLLAVVCQSHPEARLSVVGLDLLVPHSFSAKQGLLGIVTLDTLGIVLKWKLFDHAGHLGGTLFGLFYFYYGRKWMWDRRLWFVQSWHEIRGDPIR